MHSLKKITVCIILLLLHFASEAQNKSFKLLTVSRVEKNKTEILPYGHQEIYFELRDNDFVINFLEDSIVIAKNNIGVIMKRNYREGDADNIVYNIFDITKGSVFSYAKSTQCGITHPIKSYIAMRINDNVYTLPDGIVAGEDELLKKIYALSSETIDEDEFIKFIKSLETATTKDHENLRSAIDSTYTHLKKIEPHKRSGGVSFFSILINSRIDISKPIVSQIKSDTLWMDSMTRAKYRFIYQTYEAAQEEIKYIKEAGKKGVQEFEPVYTGQD